MAYYNGSAASFADLKTAIENACVAEGWTLSSDILSNNGCYVKLTSTTTELLLEGGNGQSGSSLTDVPNGTYKGAKLLNTNASPISWPITYEIHIFGSPDEVYCVVNYNSDFYMQLSFGQSDVPGIGGTGNWFTSQYVSNTLITTSYGDKVFTDVSYNSWGFRAYVPCNACGLFVDYGPSYPTSFIHCGLDSVEWLDTVGTALNGNRMGQEWSSSLVAASPSPANNAAVLIPIKCIKPRSSGGRTIVANLHNARIVVIDNIVPGDLITYGADQWKVYPFFRKDAADRNGGQWSTGASSSGVLGYAIKYTGV